MLTIQAITESHILALMDNLSFIKIINKTSAAFRKMNTHRHLAFKHVKCLSNSFYAIFKMCTGIEIWQNLKQRSLYK